MAEIIFFHHAQGQTKGFLALAQDLRQAGHTVHTPDLFDGQVFATVEEGVEYAQTVGFGVILEAGVRAAEALPTGIVYAGYSLGVLPAQKLAQTRTGAQGAIFFESCVPVSEFGDSWPTEVPVQIHGMDQDQFFAKEGDIEAARAIAESSDKAELFVYPGDKHLFADSSLSSYEPEAAALLKKRTLEFLARIDARHVEGC